jgi:predicted nuclease of predicted toxin-antitoxin system
MKLLLDMNLSPRWVARLANSGIESKHWSTIGPASAPDIDIMAYARANDLVVLTHDLDFSTILASTHGAKPSVVQVRSNDVSMEVIGDRVVLALLQMASELERGALLTVDPKRTRMRLLPLEWKG